MGATIFPVMVLNWKIISFFRFLVANSIICTAGWPKPGFQFVLLNKTYCWHVLRFHLAIELGENRSRTKSQYYFSSLLASKHLRIQTQSELRTVQHFSNCFCDVFQVMFVTMKQLAFFGHSDCNCLRTETIKSVTVRLCFFKWSTRGR